jgi:hypothetical protein
MKQTKTRPPLQNIDVEVGDWIKAKVILTSSVSRLAEKYDLSPMMIEEMGKFTGGYPIVDMRVIKGLVKRGIMKPMAGIEDGGYEFTSLGKRLCNQMFAVIGKRY